MNPYASENKNPVSFKNTDPTGNCPLLLLHGFCEDHSLWDRFSAQYPEINLITPDLPGFGCSPHSTLSTIPDIADAIIDLLNNLNVNNFAVAGHSMGGYVALQIAAVIPDRIKGLGLLHSHPYADSPTRKAIRDKAIDLLIAGKKELYLNQLFHGLFHPDYLANNESVLKQLIEKASLNNSSGIIQAIQAMRDRMDQQQVLVEAKFPVLFLLGKQDPLLPLTEQLPILSLPKITCLTLLDRVAHMGMFENSERFNQSLHDFYQLALTYN
jgi:pimeloyl-ACP methyl ester carboxylesterase